MKQWMALAAWLACSALAFGAEKGDPAGEAWVGPMRAVHAKFAGQQGTVACFGDSITITMAFFTPLQYDVKNVPDDLKDALAWMRQYVQRRCWRDWKGPEWGNEGRTTTDWGLRGIDGWLKKTNPEVALVLWGTNDTYQGPNPPKYTDNLRAIVQKCLDNGTVPILYTIPPRGDQANNPKNTKHIESFVEAARAVAAEKKVPLIDFYQEILARQPKDFAKTLLGDNLHPSYPKEYQNNFSEEALRQSGYTLRNYLTLRKYHEVHQKALAKTPAARGAAGEPEPKGATFQGRPAVFVPKLASAPTLDGKPDDPCWKDVPTLELRRLDGDPKPPLYRTEAKMGTTDDTLYLAFLCSEPGPLVSQKRERNDSVWQDDAVELFLRPGPEAERDYLHLIVNAHGSIQTALGMEEAGWQPPSVRTAVAKHSWAWSVEMAVPLGELKLPGDKARLAGPWRLNLARGRPARGDTPGEDSALAPTESDSNHVPALFAYAFFAVFGGKLPAPK